MESGEHLLVQAGTGTGKSLAYLVPAVLHAAAGKHPVVVATATIALQRQLIERDLPLLADSLEPLLGRRPEFAILKGRQHYACLLRLAEGAPDDAPGADDRHCSSPRRRRRWAGTSADPRLGRRDRDRRPGRAGAGAGRARVAVVVGHLPRVRRRDQVRATRTECFAELARERARRADVVVTNHAMLAIDAFAGIPLLPEHDVVVVDEAHELVDRATGAVTDELTAGMVERAARRIRRYVAAGDPRRAASSPARRCGEGAGRLPARPGRGGARAALRRAGRGPRRRPPRADRDGGHKTGPRRRVASDAGPDPGQGSGRGAARDRRAGRGGRPVRRASGSTAAPTAARPCCGARRCRWPDCCASSSSARPRSCSPRRRSSSAGRSTPSPAASACSSRNPRPATTRRRRPAVQ